MKFRSIYMTFGMILTFAFLSGCVHLHSVSQTQIPKERSEVVKVETSKFIFLAFNFNNDYIDTITTELRSKCPNGSVRGILTKDESVNYFLWIFHRRRITAEGFCVKA
jgi:hypothetical protein